jgi:hypothetical protein
MYSVEWFDYVSCLVSVLVKSQWGGFHSLPPYTKEERKEEDKRKKRKV